MSDINELNNILNIEEKENFTEQEKLDMYYTYSKNLLIASKEFKNLDDTLSELFFMLSKMLISKISLQQTEEQTQIDRSKSIIDSLSEEEQKKIYDELEEIERDVLGDE